jgi:MSHA biogenesis protein MshP
MKARRARPTTQHGMALVAALFMVIVVAAFGAFALRIGSAQQQTASLELLEYRAYAAANSGLEVGSRRAAAGNCNPPAPFVVGSFTVTVTCIARWNQTWDYVVLGPNRQVYDLSAIARAGVYGTPDFVQRTLTRRVSNIATGTWSALDSAA